MKAICVTPERTLEARDIPAPANPAPDHLLVRMAASAINHGDKVFLQQPAAAGLALGTTRFDVWGASGAGTVIAVGEGVPDEYAGKQVAIYRSLGRTPHTLGLWCETAEVPFTSCLILPDHVRAKDYCGSLVNAMTAYAFLEEAMAAGHQGIIVTAGNAATGLALAVLARQRRIPTILLVRDEAAGANLRSQGFEHVIVTTDGFTGQLGELAAELRATAVFDGVGGELLTRLIPVLPMHATVYCFGFLGGAVPVTLHTAELMKRDLTIRRFSNFESATVRERERLIAALNALAGIIDHPAFATRLGAEFSYQQIDEAMAYASPDGRKAILV
ncbi:Zn-dependent oxidoreductase [Duganella sp. FT80W]|uniref:Zn-dependent oxidoreductase n=1 Tax=Duganella guangzhouensis TaxID=2666084 RepID=A0A6I2KUP7_9BURK|nr:Zn-dependent oxidoreductase [Duganella guangzhouensis]MRW89411.1 Zn-dependent oxidoreductase [Duganella guangzhouensis]